MARLQKASLVAEALGQLRCELKRCEDAILALTAKLERLAPTDPGELAPRARSRDGWTQAKRQEVSRRMRAFWAARRDGASKDHERGGGAHPQ